MPTKMYLARKLANTNADIAQLESVIRSLAFEKLTDFQKDLVKFQLEVERLLQWALEQRLKHWPKRKCNR